MAKEKNVFHANGIFVANKIGQMDVISFLSQLPNICTFQFEIIFY